MNIFSLNWWLSSLVSALITMCMIYIIKRVSERVQIPVVKDIVAGV